MGITDFIPKIEGFAPLPSASADAFMSMQGGHMALYFGAYYTIGKRSMARLTNEEFNLAMEEPDKFTDILAPHQKAITQAFEKHLNEDIDRIQNLVLEKAFDIEILKIHQNVKLLKELPQAYWDAIFAVTDKLPNDQTSAQVVRTAPRGGPRKTTNTASKCKGVQSVAQNMIDLNKSAYNNYLNASARQKANRKKILIGANNRMNAYITANKECLEGWSPQ